MVRRGGRAQLAQPALPARHPRPFLPGRPRRLLHISQRYFDEHGPLCITSADTLVLLESDVAVDFRGMHCPHAAAVCICASRVVLDLQGHSLGMCTEFADECRAFSLVQVGDGGTAVSDVTVRCGTLERASHYAVVALAARAHASRRLLLDRIRFAQFERGAIQLEGWSDVHVRGVRVGGFAPRSGSSREAMLAALERRLLAAPETHQFSAGVSEERAAARQRGRFEAPSAAETPVRCIDVGAGANAPSSRVLIEDVVFEVDLAVAVREVAALGLPSSADASQLCALRDHEGHVVCYDDAARGSVVSRAQAHVSGALEAGARRALLHGVMPQGAVALSGLDVHARDLRRESSAFVRVRGASHVRVSHVHARCVRAVGEHASAAAFIFSQCQVVRLRHISAVLPAPPAPSRERALLGRASGTPASLARALSPDGAAEGGLFVHRCTDVLVEEARFQRESLAASAHAPSAVVVVDSDGVRVRAEAAAHGALCVSRCTQVRLCE